MVALPDEVMKALNNPKAMKALATVRPDGNLHVIQVGSIMAPDANTIAFGAILMKETSKNLEGMKKKGTLVSVLATVEMNSYQIRAKVKDKVTSGPLLDKMNEHLKAIGLKAGAVWTVVVDGKPGPAFDSADQNVFSPDGKHVAWIAKSPAGVKLAIDGRFAPVGAAARSPAFSADSRHVLWEEKIFNSWRVLCDGVPGPEHWGVRIADQGRVATPGKLAWYAYDQRPDKTIVLALVEADPPADRAWEDVFKGAGR
jgi:hypothetical protein